jgi:hypothetical protein
VRSFLSHAVDQLAAMTGNLLVGARWCLLLPARHPLSSSSDQAILLVLVAGAALFAHDYFFALPPRSFHLPALNRFGAVVLLSLFTAYLIGRRCDPPAGGRSPGSWPAWRSCRQRSRSWRGGACSWITTSSATLIPPFSAAPPSSGAPPAPVGLFPTS